MVLGYFHINIISFSSRNTYTTLTFACDDLKILRDEKGINQLIPIKTNIPPDACSMVQF